MQLGTEEHVLFPSNHWILYIEWHDYSVSATAIRTPYSGWPNRPTPFLPSLGSCGLPTFNKPPPKVRQSKPPRPCPKPKATPFCSLPLSINPSPPKPSNLHSRVQAADRRCCVAYGRCRGRGEQQPAAAPPRGGAVRRGRVGGGRGLVVVRGGAGGARAAGRAPRGDRRRRGRVPSSVPGPAAGRRRGAAVRGGVRGRGRRDAAQHQRQVRGPLHRGAEPAHTRPWRRLPGPRHRALPHQEHLLALLFLPTFSWRRKPASSRFYLSTARSACTRQRWTGTQKSSASSCLASRVQGPFCLVCSELILVILTTFLERKKDKLCIQYLFFTRV